jgi:hypothetical protein
MRLRTILLVTIVSSSALALAGCTSTMTVADGTWTAECVGVVPDDCKGVAELFVNNLARAGGAVRQESGGIVQVTPVAQCPPLPDWADPPCWRANAPMRTGRACMLVARQKDPVMSLAGFGQVGGDYFTGLVDAPPIGTTPC